VASELSYAWANRGGAQQHVWYSGQLFGKQESLIFQFSHCSGTLPQSAPNHSRLLCPLAVLSRVFVNPYHFESTHGWGAHNCKAQGEDEGEREHSGEDEDDGVARGVATDLDDAALIRYVQVGKDVGAENNVPDNEDQPVEDGEDDEALARCAGIGWDGGRDVGAGSQDEIQKQYDAVHYKGRETNFLRNAFAAASSNS
jgi:hypothetical protein